MQRDVFLTFSRWVAVMLLTASFVIPSVHSVHAAEMEMDHERMHTECKDTGCEDSEAKQDCLEHCLQTNASDGVLFVIAPHQNDTQSDTIHQEIFERPARKAAKLFTQKTGPPHNRERHLTTQKRE